MVQLLLNIVVFISGAVLMALEIVGSRVLAATPRPQKLTVPRATSTATPR